MLVFACVLTTVTGDNNSNSAVFQFPEYDYKETSKNVSIDFSADETHPAGVYARSSEFVCGCVCVSESFLCCADETFVCIGAVLP